MRRLAESLRNLERSVPGQFEILAAENTRLSMLESYYEHLRPPFVNPRTVPRVSWGANTLHQYSPQISHMINPNPTAHYSPSAPQLNMFASSPVSERQQNEHLSIDFGNESPIATNIPPPRFMAPSLVNINVPPPNFNSVNSQPHGFVNNVHLPILDTCIPLPTYTSHPMYTVDVDVLLIKLNPHSSI